MRLFRRKNAAADPPDPRTAWPEQHVPEDPAAAAEAFWRGWYDLLPMVSAALGEGSRTGSSTSSASSSRRCTRGCTFRSSVVVDRSTRWS